MSAATIHDFRRWKEDGKRFAALTAYDAPSARILAEAGIPVILVGDSVGNVVLGYDSTVPVTMDEMLHHGRAVRRGAPQSFVVGDLPFLSYQVSAEQAVENAGRFVKEAGVDAVKLEGGTPVVSSIRRIVDAGVPVMGHLGLTPQSTRVLGGFKVQGTTRSSAREILESAHAIVDAGVFAIVLECIPEQLAARITAEVPVPTIGIGAGSGCDAQILVLHDVLGIESGFKPRFVRAYGDIQSQMQAAVSDFARDVVEGSFPSPAETFSMSEEEWRSFDDDSR